MNAATRLLLEMARPSPAPKRIRQLAIHPEMDWEAAYRLACRHQMVGIAVPLLRASLDGNLPESPQTPWAHHWLRLQAHDLAQLARLEELLVAASAQGIRPVLLKGFSVHFHAYTSTGAARGSSDIDLLVRPSEALPMRACLEQLRFLFRGADSWSRPVSDWATFLSRDSEAQFRHAGSGVWVDLHWRLCAPALEKACGLHLSGRLLENTRTLPVGRVTAAIPGREEEVLMLCLHLTKVGLFTLRNLCDLARMISISPPVRWERLLRLAQETGTSGCLFWALHLVDQVAPGAVPESTRSQLAAAAGPRWLLGPFLRIDRLMATQGATWLDLPHFWNGVFFIRRPWRWPPYQAKRIGGWLARRTSAMLRWSSSTRAISSAG